MRRLPFLVVLLLLPLPASVPAAPADQSAPEWRSGDMWAYEVRDGSGKPVGELTVKVVDERDVRAGNSTLRAYNLTQRLAPWTPANKTRLSEPARWGPIYTLVLTNLTVAKRDLCTLYSESTLRSVHYSDVTEDRERLVYSPSDGRLRFPLAAGTGWNATFNQTRTRQFPFHRITENSTISRQYECQAFERLPDGKEGFRIRCADDGAGRETVSWFSPSLRSEVRREERETASGAVRVYTLTRYEAGRTPSLFSNPQTMLAIAFGAAAALMLAGAAFAAYRARHPSTGHRPKKEAAPAPAPGEAPTSRTPPAPVPAAGKGPGRSL